MYIPLPCKLYKICISYICNSLRDCCLMYFLTSLLFPFFLNMFRSLLNNMSSFFLTSSLGMCPTNPNIFNVSPYDHHTMLAVLRHTAAPHINLTSNGRMKQISNCCDEIRSPFEISLIQQQIHTH